MTRNQKIALGCGGAGCLGLIVVAVAVGLIYYFAISNGFNYSGGSNRNSNRNDNRTNRNDNTTNSNDNSSRSSSSSSSSSSDASSLSDDEKHKLYQAALMTADQEVVRRVSVRMGIMNEDFTPGAEWEQFITDHVGWMIRNGSFIKSIDTAEKAREYINNNLPD